MKIHEYQAKELLRRYGVPVPQGRVAQTPEEAERIAKELGGLVVVKAQIHAGGRGKGGGVKLAQGPAEAKARAAEILGMQLITHQTGPEGQKVRKVLVEQGTQIKQELYLGMTLDRETSRVTLMASAEGGVEIEEVAARAPEKIFKTALDPVVGLSSYQGRTLGYALGLSKEIVAKLVDFARGLSVAYERSDASLFEINPLVITAGGEVIALDAKVNFDDNALFRHPDLAALRDRDEEDPREDQAREYDLSYVALDGDIACMVNGAGLAMKKRPWTSSSWRVVRPANFLDVGGGADVKRKRDRGLQDLAGRRPREGGAGQHLRRDHEVRRDRRRDREGLARGGVEAPAGGAPRGDQRGAGQEDPRRERARDHQRRRHARRR